MNETTKIIICTVVSIFGGIFGLAIATLIFINSDESYLFTTLGAMSIGVILFWKITSLILDKE